MNNDNKRSDDSLSEEASAFGKRVKGAAKDGIGSITGNSGLEREGERENAEGRARQAANNVFDETDGVRGATVGGGADRQSDFSDRSSANPATPPNSIREETAALGERVKGAVKDGIGSVTGNRRLEREGELENAEGRARQAGNEVFDDANRATGSGIDRDDVRNSAVLDRPASIPPNSIREEAAGFGQRVKGAVKDGVGSITGNERLEREGERENQIGRTRQAANDAVDAPGTPRTWDSKWSREHLVTGLYDTPDSARKAYDDLTARHGYKDDDISVVMTDETRTRHFGDAKPGTEFKEGTKAAEGAGIGGGIGLGVGAALGAIIAAATAIVIPGIGLVVAGPIAGAIAGAGAGSATGTLLGALIGAGIPETRAAEYERGLNEGGIVLGTRARDEAHATELEQDFTSHGARNILR
ncbi:MAG: CsbD family protein [Vicinamibacterales bacterium]